MKIATNQVMLLVTLALGSFALGVVTTAKVSAAPAASPTVPFFPVSSGDASVPLASTVKFGDDEGVSSPTF
jgi:hypothetical protein